MKIIGNNLPGIPWQDKPVDCTETVWRYSENPIIKGNHIPCSNSIFNSAVVPYGDGFKGVFRVDDKRIRPRLHVGNSKDGIHWDIEETPIRFNNEKLCDPEETGTVYYAYDPRVCFIEDRYYITWCAGYHGPTIGLAYTFDFETFYRLENAFLPYNRNGVLFPKKINGKFGMLSRPSDTGHTQSGDIFYSESTDLEYWGHHRHVMAPQWDWGPMKIGAGPVPIETDEGWLLFYHGVLNTCNGMVYRMGVALLDKDEPWKVLKRGRYYLLSPTETYECQGDVRNVVFPCACLTDAESGKITIYYGCADTVTGMAFTTIDEISKFLEEQNSDPIVYDERDL